MENNGKHEMHIWKKTTHENSLDGRSLFCACRMNMGRLTNRAITACLAHAVRQVASLKRNHPICQLFGNWTPKKPLISSWRSIKNNQFWDFGGFPHLKNPPPAGWITWVWDVSVHLLDPLPCAWLGLRLHNFADPSEAGALSPHLWEEGQLFSIYLGL
jgi:hypothetical protein